MKEKRTNNGRLFFGIAFIIIGLMFLYAKLDIDILGVWREAVLSIPMICVIVGLLYLCYKRFLTGLLILGIGVFFILPLLPYEVVPLGFCGKWWPLLLIYFGVLMVLFRKTPVSATSEQNHANETLQDAEVTFDESGRIDCRVGLHGERQIFNEPVFKGGEINVNCGGLELDLRNTTLAEGTVSLNVNVHVGGVTLYIPNDWSVEISSNGFLGGFADKRKNIYPSATNSRLHIIVNTFLGGGEIRS